MQASAEISAVRKGCTTYFAELTVEVLMQQDLYEDYLALELCVCLRAR